MAVNFTPEQQRVIDLHNCNILVSAAAGSGKTAVLVERIIRMVCNEEKPVDIDRLLIVTFTNAAAAEMRERIANGISKRLMEHPESEHIQRQATLLHNAQITTIDSFCLFLLRNHFNEIGLDPAFRIADEGEIKLMQQEVLQELIEDSYASGEEVFRYCVEYFCPGGRERVLEQHILNLSRYASSFPWPAQWLLERKADYDAATVEELCESSYGAFVVKYLHNMLDGCVEKYQSIRKLCEMPDGPYMYGELVDRELEQLQKLLSCASLSEYEVKLPTITFERLPSKKDDSVSAVKRELAKNMRGEVKDTIQKLTERFFATPLELTARQGAACKAPVCTLIDLVLEFDGRMQAKKQEKKVIDFSDMEHYALEILLDRKEVPVDSGDWQKKGHEVQGDMCEGNLGENGMDRDAKTEDVEAGKYIEIRPSAVAQEYRQHFAEILIDEYQDSNLVQEYLLKAVSGEEDGNFNRFMVGDVKQSIYKFRLARPELFLEKYQTYQADGGDCQRIDLAKNFRSRVEVVNAVNDVFLGLMSETVGGIAYDERAALYPGATYVENADCCSELLLIEKPEKNDDLGEKQAEALAIARKIKDLRTHFKVMDKESGELRPAKYSDMVILLRTNSGWDEEFKGVLEQEGIPVYITSKTGYFAASEVQELLQLLRVLDNPTQDIPLFSVMKSIFGGFSEEEIALIRSQAKGVSLYEALKRVAEEVPAETGGQGQSEESRNVKVSRSPEESEKSEESEIIGESKNLEEPGNTDGLRKKVSDFLRMIANYRRCTVYLPIRDLLNKLVNDFDYLNYVTALPAGGKRRANVEMLFTKASDFEKTSYFGLFHFIRYMEQLEKYDVDYGEAELLDENADVVRIMSIHKSKGLEFPITFVSGLSKHFNMQDANQSLILDMDLGLGTDYVNPKRRVRNKTLRRMAIAGKLKEDSLSEELRVLYVALTRAREKLILTGVVKDAAATWEQWKEFSKKKISYLDFMEARSYLDFLFPILGNTGIKVTLVEALQLEAGQMGEQFEMALRRKNLREAKNRADEEALRRLEGCLNAVYPYDNLKNLYTKTTVSELKIAAMADKDEAAFHTFEEKEEEVYIPAFRRQEEEKVSGTVRGNAYHRVMELLDFEHLFGEIFASGKKSANEQGKNCYGETMDYQIYWNRLKEIPLEKHIKEFLQKEVETKRLPKEYFEAINIRKIKNFLMTKLAYRMWRAHCAGMLYKEQPFVLGIPAYKLSPEYPEGESVLIQGIIDAFFVEEDGIVLLDYKTDSVKSMEELVRRYETQLEYYQEALEKLMNLPVKEKLLYSFSLETY